MSTQSKLGNSDALYPTYFTTRPSAQLALYLIANREMSLQDLVVVVPNFKDKGLLKELVQKAKTINISMYLQNQGPQDSVEEFLSEDLITECKQSIDKSFGTINRKTSNTGLQENIESSLLAMRKKHLQISMKNTKQNQRTPYLGNLFATILRRLGEQCPSQLTQKILKYGGVEAAYAQPVFMKNQKNRDIFKDIINKCSSFKEFKQSSGKDLAFQRKNVLREISKCLIQLQVNESTSQEISKQLLTNPISNIVAGHKKLTNLQKQGLYKSPLYSKELLREYAHTLEYRNSLEFKAKAEIATILRQIQGNHIRITSQILQNVLAYQLYNLLALPAIESFKRKILEFVLESCPFYLRIFKMKHQDKKNFNARMLKESLAINRKFDLTNSFLQARLAFQEWEEAQSEILKKNYQVVDQLALKFQGRQGLFHHIFQDFQPSFHSEEKTWDYKYQVQLTLLRQLLANMEKMSFDILRQISAQTLSSSSLKSQCAENQLPRALYSHYQQALKKKEIVEFIKSSNIDVKEVAYQSTWELKRAIYRINNQDRISVPYFHIHGFAQQSIEAKSFPPRTNIFITNMTKLSASFKFTGLVVESKEDLMRNFHELAGQLVAAYIKSEPDSKFQNLLIKKFQSNEVEYVKRIVRLNGMEKDNNNFFDGLGLSEFVLRNTKTQFVNNNKGEVGELLRKCKQVLSKLSNYQESSSIREDVPAQKKKSPTKDKRQLEAEFEQAAKTFYKNYCDKFDGNQLEKICDSKFEVNEVNLIKKIIQTKAFESKETSFFNIGLTSLAERRARAEFAENKDYALTNLKRCIEIYQQMQ